MNASFSAIEGSRNIEDLKGITEPVCTATPMPGVHEVRILQLLTCGLRPLLIYTRKSAYKVTPVALCIQCSHLHTVTSIRYVLLYAHIYLRI